MRHVGGLSQPIRVRRLDGHAASTPLGAPGLVRSGPSCIEWLGDSTPRAKDEVLEPPAAERAESESEEQQGAERTCIAPSEGAAVAASPGVVVVVSGRVVVVVSS